MSGDAPTSVLITGATSTLGQPLAALLLEDPACRLLLTSRSTDMISGLCGHPRVHHAPGIDLTRPDHLATLRSEADHFFSERFSVVNAVGSFVGHKPFEDVTLDDARMMFESNYLAVYGVAQYVVPLVLARGGGHFVTFSCNSVQHHYPWMAAFTATKAAVQSLTNSLANEYARSGLIANSILMSTMRTERECRLKPFGDHSHWASPQEVASVVRTLLRDDVGLVNGSSLSIFRHSDSFFHQSYFDRIRAK